VRELGFDDEFDTLGRWMAHHLAELIDQSENGATAAERTKARKSATETILKIWEHRTSLPGKAYPLAPYKDILMVLDRLRPNDNPFWHFRHHVETKREQLAAGLFDSLTRLIIALLLMKIQFVEESAKVDTAAIEALSDEEQHIFRALQQWIELLTSTDKSNRRTRKSKKGNDLAKINLNEVAIQWIDNITTTLAELRSELHKIEGQPQ
jgi:hypothetical protein